MTISQKITVQAERPPVVELDTVANAAYIRFSRNKVARTEALTTEGQLVTLDLDRRGNTIGIELVGVREFTISKLLKAAGVTRQIPNELQRQTRYVPAKQVVAA